MAKITLVILILLPIVYFSAAKPVDQKKLSFEELVQDIKHSITEAVEKIVEEIKSSLLGDLIKLTQNCENVTTIDDVNIKDLELSEQMNTVLHEEYESMKQNYTSFEDYLQKGIFQICQDVNNSTTSEEST